MKFIRTILLNNLIIKLISLILAVLTWVYIAQQLYNESIIKGRAEGHSIIEVSGEKLIVKKLPIYVNIEGTPAAGYTLALERIVTKPSTAVVAGPPDVIRDLSYVTTDPVNISDASYTVKRSVSLTDLPNCKIGYKDLVSVTIPIVRDKRR